MSSNWDSGLRSYSAGSFGKSELRYRLLRKSCKHDITANIGTSGQSWWPAKSKPCVLFRLSLQQPRAYVQDVSNNSRPIYIYLVHSESRILNIWTSCWIATYMFVCIANSKSKENSQIATLKTASNTCTTCMHDNIQQCLACHVASITGC